MLVIVYDVTISIIVICDQVLLPIAKMNLKKEVVYLSC